MKNLLTLLALAVLLGVGSFAMGASLESYGELYYHDDNGVSQSVPTLNVYHNITVWNSTNSVRYMTETANGLAPIAPGVYKVDWQLSFSGAGNHEYQVVVYLDETEQPECEAHRKLGSGGDVGSMSETCLISVAAGQDITLRVEDESNPATDITVYAANINVVKIE